LLLLLEVCDVIERILTMDFDLLLIDNVSFRFDDEFHCNTK